MEKKKIIALGISGISLMLAAAITSTVAWYTGSSYLAITNIDISLYDPVLRISKTGNADSFVEKLHVEDKELKFTAVSSTFKEEWLNRREEKPIFKDGYALGTDYLFNKSRDFKTVDTGYFSETFYLYCDIDAYITFDKELTYVKANNPYNQETDKINDVTKSMRFSVLVLDDDLSDGDDYKYYIYDPNKTEDKITLLGGILDTSGSGYYNTYNHKEVLFGDITSVDPENLDPRNCIEYDDPLPEETALFTRNEMTCFKANNVKGDMKVNFAKSYEKGLVIKEEGAIGPQDIETKLLIPISAGKTRKIVLSFYQEGWDRDNTNFIIHSNFLINVAFMIAPVNPWA